jgi:hypothetical protein
LERAGWINMEDISGEYKNYSTTYLFVSYFKEIFKLLRLNKQLRKEHKKELKEISKESLIQKFKDFFNRFPS